MSTEPETPESRPVQTISEFCDGNVQTCPSCGSDKVDGSGPQREWQQCFTDCGCRACGAVWSAVFNIPNCANLRVRDENGNDGETFELPDESPTIAHPAAVRQRPVCRICRSSNVRADALAAWDMAAQEWTISATFDKGAVCEDCGGETTLDWEPEAKS